MVGYNGLCCETVEGDSMLERKSVEVVTALSVSQRRQLQNGAALQLLGRTQTDQPRKSQIT
jgi:hypothetical protein